MLPVERIHGCEDALSSLETLPAVVPRYVKERLVQFLAAVKIRIFSREEKRIAAFFSVRKEIRLLQDRPEGVDYGTCAAKMVFDEVAGRECQGARKEIRIYGPSLRCRGAFEHFTVAVRVETERPRIDISVLTLSLPRHRGWTD